MRLFDGWLAFRNRCLTSPVFHEFAQRFPPFRPIVRKRQSEVFDVVAGFVYSQILQACVELGVLQLSGLQQSGMSLEALSNACDLPPDETRRLADGAVSLRILQRSNELYFLGDLGAALSINTGALAMIKHHSALYQDLGDPVSLLKSGRQETSLSRYWDYARSLDPTSAKAEDITSYSELMSASQDDVSKEILASFDFSGFKTMLDLGGGQGTFARNLLSAYPELDITVFDLPQVVERGRAKLSGESSRISFEGGSFFEDDLPMGKELVTLVRILHDHDDEPVQNLLNKAFQCLEPGGTLMIAEPMSTGGHAKRISDAYFNFYLYAMGSGRPRRPKELKNMLNKAGFAYAELKSTRFPFTASIIVAQK
ncbi:MAG: methyltransferase [Pseudomonadota bacterium]